jgi:hypothetical protein
VVDMGKKLNDAALQESVETAKKTSKNKKAVKEIKESLSKKRK